MTFDHVVDKGIKTINERIDLFDTKRRPEHVLGRRHVLVSVASHEKCDIERGSKLLCYDLFGSSLLQVGSLTGQSGRSTAA